MINKKTTKQSLDKKELTLPSKKGELISLQDAKPINIVYISLGSNLGNKYKNIQNAISYISKEIGKVTAQSSIYETAPWGFSSDNYFFNNAIKIETSHTALEVLQLTQQIEKRMGRKVKSDQAKYSDRIIDIDIIFFNDFILESEKLIIPHPFLHQRKFVLEPLREIAPDFIHPVLKNTISELLNQIDPD